METSLHRELKAHYAGTAGACEVVVDGYRIDAIVRGRLIEVQHASLAAIRRKIADLLTTRRVLVVKPIVVQKQLVRLAGRGGAELSRRRSPKRGGPLDLFDELVHFTTVFPHPRLTLETPLIAVEERRYPGHGRRRRWRVDDYQVEDQRLVELRDGPRFRAAADLWRLLPAGLPTPFQTRDLAESLAISRGLAQRIAYVLHRCGAARQVGKQGNARLYAAIAPRKRRAA